MDGVVVEVKRVAVFGEDQAFIKKLTDGSSYTVNTSFIERNNLYWRMWDAHIGRKSLCFAKSLSFLKAKFGICVTFYNFCRNIVH